MDARLLLQENGLKPNKALGQNFLIDAETLGRIADAAVSADALPILEIGAGLGALTEALQKRGAAVTAVEKDAQLAAILGGRLPDLRVVCADFLDLEIPKLMGTDAFCAAGNLPYYITTPIAEHLLPALPKSAVLMVQKEAAERFFAAPGERVYGPLAVLTQVFYRPELLFCVPPDAFWPQPAVDSAVVSLTLCRDDAPCAPKALLRFCRMAFSMRRKTLFNALQRDPLLPPALEALGLSQTIRAEAMSPAQLAQLCRIMNREVSS